MTLKEKVEDALKEVRPMLQADGGDIDLISVTDDGKVTIKLTGACSGCPMSSMTLKMGVERIIKKKVPEIKEVFSA
jgi:Fe-S cluster biogenesis protein NfuA